MGQVVGRGLRLHLPQVTTFPRERVHTKSTTIPHVVEDMAEMAGVTVQEVYRASVLHRRFQRRVFPYHGREHGRWVRLHGEGAGFESLTSNV
jgi:hypothetical protein